MLIRSTFDQMVYEIRFENVYRRVFSLLQFYIFNGVHISVCVCLGYLCIY